MTSETEVSREERVALFFIVCLVAFSFPVVVAVVVAAVIVVVVVVVCLSKPIVQNWIGVVPNDSQPDSCGC